MEFWEGAVLVVGGIWLVGKVSRKSSNHPINSAQASLSPAMPYGNTVDTQTDGSTNLVWGEPLAPPLPPLSTSTGIATVTHATAPIATHPVIHSLPPNIAPLRFNPVPTVPKVPAKVVASSYANRVPVRGKFLDL